MLSTTILSWQRDGYTISTDPSLLDLDMIHAYLYRSYWSPGVPREVVAKAMENSLCFGLYVQGDGETSIEQIGYARVVTDFTTFAYLADVFVLPTHQGKGLGVWLIDCVMNTPSLTGIRSFLLATRDAQSLYEKFGFETLADPRRIMVARYEMPWYRPELAETHEEANGHD